MPATNTTHRYGAISRMLHWLTALVILAAFPLGLMANRIAVADDASIERAFFLFSLHKTVGVMALTIGLIRIGWSLTQTRPAPLYLDRQLETNLATFTHWTLTLALVVVPVSGWLTHAAEPGLSPLLVPFPDTFAVVPQTPGFASTTAAIHWIATKLLAVAILLHVAGALKHTLIDRDDTLRRMWRGTPAGPGVPAHGAGPAIGAFILWSATLVGGTLIAERPPAPPVAWPASSTEILLLRAEDASEIGTFAAADITLTLSEDGTGTLDIFAALDSIDAPEADAFLATTLLPILTYSGTVTGPPPDLTATGPLDIGGTVSDLSISITRDGDTAQFFQTIPIETAPEFVLEIDASFKRPEE